MKGGLTPDREWHQMEDNFDMIRHFSQDENTKSILARSDYFSIERKIFPIP